MPQTTDYDRWPAWTQTSHWAVAEEPDDATDPTNTVEVNGGEAAEANDADQDEPFVFFPDDEFDEFPD